MSITVIGKHEKDARPCRDALALTLKEMMAQDKSICYVDCDLMNCVNTKQLLTAYPDRAFEAGIAEANGAGVSAGMAAAGKTVFFHSFGTFASRRCYDQIYMSAAYAGLTVHVLGSDPGVTAAFNGGTHMPLEDGAMYCSIPEATVLDAADFVQLQSIIRQLPGIKTGVTYTRFPRKDVIQVYGDDSAFTIGKGVTLRESSQDQAAGHGQHPPVDDPGHGDDAHILAIGGGRQAAHQRPHHAGHAVADDAAGELLIRGLPVHGAAGGGGKVANGLYRVDHIHDHHGDDGRGVKGDAKGQDLGHSQPTGLLDGGEVHHIKR